MIPDQSVTPARSHTSSHGQPTAHGCPATIVVGSIATGWCIRPIVVEPLPRQPGWPRGRRHWTCGSVRWSCNRSTRRASTVNGKSTPVTVARSTCTWWWRRWARRQNSSWNSW